MQPGIEPRSPRMIQNLEIRNQYIKQKKKVNTQKDTLV